MKHDTDKIDETYSLQRLHIAPPDEQENKGNSSREKSNFIPMSAKPFHSIISINPDSK
jgi:hypothetical protein